MKVSLLPMARLRQCHHTPILHIVRGENSRPRGDAHSKACEIVVAVVVHAGHLCCLAAHQPTVGQHTPIGNALYVVRHFRTSRAAICGIPRASTHLNDVGSGMNVQLAARIVVEEEERFCALHDQIVDAHGHEILTCIGVRCE